MLWYYFQNHYSRPKATTSSEGTCQGDALIFWKHYNIGYLPRDGKDGVYMLASVCFHHDIAKLLLHNFWTHFLWTHEACEINLMGPNVAQTQKSNDTIPQPCQTDTYELLYGRKYKRSLI